jgi:hypothetical protein
LGRRSRKQRNGGAAAKPATGALPTAPEPNMSRTERRNAEARARLEPLAEGERPLPVTIGAIVAAALVVVQIPLYFVFDGDERPSAPGFAAFLALMLVMAWGMWRVRYWAVLGFQALLAICILVVSLAAMTASNLVTALICAAIVIPAAALFWFMVRALARIQMPTVR